MQELVEFKCKPGNIRSGSPEREFSSLGEYPGAPCKSAKVL
jgi:hypothetical protein